MSPLRIRSPSLAHLGVAPAGGRPDGSGGPSSDMHPMRLDLHRWLAVVGNSATSSAASLGQSSSFISSLVSGGATEIGQKRGGSRRPFVVGCGSGRNHGRWTSPRSAPAQASAVSGPAPGRDRRGAERPRARTPVRCRSCTRVRATASPAPERAPPAPGVVADELAGADLGANAGRREVLGGPQRERDGHSAVSKPRERAAGDHHEHRRAAPAAVAANGDRGDDGSSPELLRSESHPLAHAVPVEPETLPWRRAGRASSRPRGVHRGHRVHPQLDRRVEVDDSCFAPSSFQWARSTTGGLPNRPPSSISVDRPPRRCPVSDGEFHRLRPPGRRNWRGTSAVRRRLTNHAGSAESASNASAGCALPVCILFVRRSAIGTACSRRSRWPRWQPPERRPWLRFRSPSSLRRSRPSRR